MKFGNLVGGTRAYRGYQVPADRRDGNPGVVGGWCAVISPAPEGQKQLFQPPVEKPVPRSRILCLP